MTFNISQTYFDKDDSWAGILAASAFTILSKNRLKGYSPGQFVFGCDIIIHIKHDLDWELIRQKNQAQMNKDNIQKDNKRVDHDYKFGYKVMLDNHAT